jgi:transaldolase/glucose-6-phosphate isomerase
MENPIMQARGLGQSIWYDNIRRSLITSGEIRELVDEGVLGVTSNPAIFEKALAGSTDYDQALEALVTQGLPVRDIYERLAVEDIQLAADALRPAYLHTRGRDGYVSIEVSPYLAHDTEATIEQARQLHSAVGRENVMIKVPATPEGMPAVTELVAQGIPVNVTLLFAVDVYEAVAGAYMTGLEKLAAIGGEPGKAASVASFFVSRIDSYIDDKLGKALNATQDPGTRAKLDGLLGKAAIANAKLAYARYRELYSQDRWKALAAKGARPQRLLWASTSTKNPNCSPTLYVEELIGPDTVNTVPADTLAALRACGPLRASLLEDGRQAQETVRALGEIGISLKEATDWLLADGVDKFSAAFDRLLAGIEKKREALLKGGLAR